MGKDKMNKKSKIKLGVLLAATVLSLLFVCMAVLEYIEVTHIPMMKKVLYSIGIMEKPSLEEALAKKGITFEKLQKKPPTAEEIFHGMATIQESYSAESSNRSLTESEALLFFEERGFNGARITTDYEMDGSFLDEKEISGSSTAMHPYYMADYVSKTGDIWKLMLVDGDFFAMTIRSLTEDGEGNEAAQNLQQIILTESNTLTSYAGTDSTFYKIMPNAAVANMMQVQRIDKIAIDQWGVEGAGQ